MTATAQFSRPIIVGIVYLAAIVRFLTSLARRKETKPALNQHGSYRKLLVKRRLVKAMPDILIRMEKPRTCADCHDADLPTAIAWLGAKCPWAHGIIDPGVYDLRHGRHPDCPLHELPPHGDLIDRDAVQYTYSLQGGVLMTSNKILEKLPTVVPAERRESNGN